jgi:hypothetical protein
VARWDDLAPATWDDLAPLLAAQRRGEPGVLRGPVALWERTAGSTGPSKVVPVSRGVQGAFTWMLAVWLGDLLARGPALRRGRAWVSATPALAPRGPAVDGVLEGAADDGDYVSAWARPLLRRFFLDTSDLLALTDGPAFLDALAGRLLATEDLEVVSVWSPSLLTLVLDRARARGAAGLGPRAAAAGDWASVWPRLRCVSAWGDAHAGRALAEVRAALPGVYVQPKGLLATEGPVTVPLVGVEGGAPLVDAVVVEVMDGGRLRPLAELAPGEGGELVVSWPGGLTRYRLGDVVEVTGRVASTPCLRLVGRVGGAVDLVGEKLTEGAASAALAAAPPGVWAMLVPSLQPPGYVLWTDAPLPDAARSAVEATLAASAPYATALGLGQLAPLRARVDLDARARWLATATGRIGERKDRALGPVGLLDDGACP